MRLWSLRSALALSLALLVAGAQLPLGAQVATGAPERDWAAFLGPYPALGTEAAREEVAVMLWLQRARTRQDVLRAEGEVAVQFGLFAPSVGLPLVASRFPLTFALLEAATVELRVVSRGLKQHFARPRPFLTDARLHPAVTLENSFSYPSGHGAWGMVTATILARLAPERSVAILEFGRQVGHDRVLAGVHYPSDVEAGQRLGAAQAEAWLRDPIRARQLEAARAAEWPEPASSTGRDPAIRTFSREHASESVGFQVPPVAPPGRCL